MGESKSVRQDDTKLTNIDIEAPSTMFYLTTRIISIREPDCIEKRLPMRNYFVKLFQTISVVQLAYVSKGIYKELKFHR